MATKLDSFEFGRTREGVKHPWNEWLNGDIWKLVRGVDFKPTVANFRNAAYVEGKRRNLKVNTAQVDETTLVIQAIVEH